MYPPLSGGGERQKVTSFCQLAGGAVAGCPAPDPEKEEPVGCNTYRLVSQSGSQPLSQEDGI